jgi:hypothetical protein
VGELQVLKRGCKTLHELREHEIKLQPNPRTGETGLKAGKLRENWHVAALARTAELILRSEFDTNCTNTEKNCNFFQITNLL